MDPFPEAQSPAPAPVWSVVHRAVIDPAVCSFLADHQVGGAALLPTVIQLDLVAGAFADLVGAGAGLTLSDVRVQAPVRFPAGSSAARTLRVLARRAGPDGGRDVELRGEDGEVHLSARVSTGEGLPTLEPLDGAGDGELPGTADLVYPPLFHGPAFQVFGRFGRVPGGLAAEPSASGSSWVVPGSGGVLPVRLLELAFQACGVWELAETGRMMRPSRIAQVVLPGPVAAGAGVGARVLVRPDPELAGAFDGVVLDVEGRVLLSVRGYQPVELAVPVDPDVSTRIAARIGVTR